MPLTAPQTFTRAVRARLTTDRAGYVIVGPEMPFATAIDRQDGSHFAWKIVKTYVGDGPWSHVVRVTHEDDVIYYFVR